jgi:D-alanine transaminase
LLPCAFAPLSQILIIMKISYFNGKFLPHNEISISPDDRGFLFADGVYEVVRWYEGFFFDINSHVERLKRSLRELSIKWDDAGNFPSIAEQLLRVNKLMSRPSLIYIQVTRGSATRSHSFPVPDVLPTVYANAWEFTPDSSFKKSGVKVMLKEDIRWSRCDIKSVALLPNTMSFQEAYSKGLQECIFIRNGLITEGTHSNIFFIINNTLFTHPESNYILSGITRKNVLRIAKNKGIRIKEEAVHAENIKSIQEAFISSTTAEVTPVLSLGGGIVGDGKPGPVTRLIQAGFDSEITGLKG